ncbi:MAG: DMT family transporter [Planctomycetales bacterium]|nr:DMT family transporter [Planctomycetales bacterium]
MSSKSSVRGLADASLLLTTVLWGLNIVVVKAAISQLDPLAFNAIRLVLSTFALGLLAALDRSRSTPSSTESKTDPTSTELPPRRTPFPTARVIVFTLFSGLIYPLLFIFGINQTPAGNAALLLATMPIWTAGLSFLILHERLPRLVWIGLSVSLVGTVVVIVSGGKVDLSASYWIGNLLMLGAAAAWASATVASGPLLQRIAPMRLAFLANLVTTPIHLLIAAPKIPAALAQLDQPAALLAVIYSGALSTGLAYGTWHYGVSKLGGSHASVYQNFVTLIAVLAAWLILNEQITSFQIVGGIGLFIGLYLMRRGRRVARPAEQKAG